MRRYLLTALYLAADGYCDHVWFILAGRIDLVIQPCLAVREGNRLGYPAAWKSKSSGFSIKFGMKILNES